MQHAGANSTVLSAWMGACIHACLLCVIDAERTHKRKKPCTAHPRQNPPHPFTMLSLPHTALDRDKDTSDMSHDSGRERGMRDVRMANGGKTRVRGHGVKSDGFVTSRAVETAVHDDMDDGGYDSGPDIDGGYVLTCTHTCPYTQKGSFQPAVRYVQSYVQCPDMWRGALTCASYVVICASLLVAAQSLHGRRCVPCGSSACRYVLTLGGQIIGLPLA